MGMSLSRFIVLGAFGWTLLVPMLAQASKPYIPEEFDAKSREEDRKRILALPLVRQAEKAFGNVHLDMETFDPADRRAFLRFAGPKFKLGKMDCASEYLYMSAYGVKGLTRPFPAIDAAWIEGKLEQARANEHLKLLGASGHLETCALRLSEGPDVGTPLVRAVVLGLTPVEPGQMGDQIEMTLKEEGSGTRVIAFRFPMSAEVWPERLKMISVSPEPLRNVLLSAASVKSAKKLCPKAEPAKISFLAIHEQGDVVEYRGSVQGQCEFKIRAGGAGQKMSQPEWTKFEPGPV